MSDDKPTLPPEETPAAEEKAPEQTAAPESGEKPEKQPLSDEEKAAKIAEAKAKAAAKKAAEAAEPKDPWEEKPVPPTHEPVLDDPDAVALGGEMPGVVLAADRFAGEVTLSVPADRIIDVCRFLKYDCDYKFLVDLTAIDWPERENGRFDVIYWMHRYDDSKRLRLQTVVAEDAPIASVTEVWKTANWMEREVYDLFGIVFENHPGLERILTWEGFNGHPLRKDFPVEGIDTGAAIYPDVYPPGGGPQSDEAEDGDGGAE
ncbi:MAG: NADH-quinone oxidoreductase subunit C [Acidobacteria bacterium]|nr:NADH-quinone oxidoreductase subunit C [Candidatus Sulfomarinibacter kjeldsenii]